MPAQIGSEDVRALMERGAQLVDVMPMKEYGESHLAGAINVPLTRLDATAVADLDRDRPVIVYCFDTQ